MYLKRSPQRRRLKGTGKRFNIMPGGAGAYPAYETASCRPGKAEPPPGKNHTSDAGTTLGFSGFALTAITTPTTSSAMPQAVNSGGKLWRIRKV